MASNAIDTISREVSAICEANGAFLYDVEMIKEGKNQVLRIYIDTESGIGIDECETISRLISQKLDDIDVVKSAYNLEVSSPGVERKLRLQKHFDMAAGKMIDITLYAPVNGEKNFSGILKYADEKKVIIETNSNDTEFEREAISTAKIHFDINEFLKNN